MKQNGSNRAINAPLAGTHIQIIACAGSGKTEAVAFVKTLPVKAAGAKPKKLRGPTGPSM